VRIVRSSSPSPSLFLSLSLSFLYHGRPRHAGRHLWPGLLKFYAPRDKTYRLLLIAAISPALQLLDWAITGPVSPPSRKHRNPLGGRLTAAPRLPLSDFGPAIAGFPVIPVDTYYRLRLIPARSACSRLLASSRTYQRVPASKPEGKARAHFP